MPYLKDPRGRVTLNFPAAEYEALVADANRAAHVSPGTYALALVRARGAALRPVLDENGRLRVARLQGKIATLTEVLAAAEARAAALATELRATQLELEQRPTRTQVQQAIAEGIGAHRSEAGAPTEAPTVEAPTALTPEAEAEARRRRMRKRQRETERKRP